jgi:hypothetical protein
VQISYLMLKEQSQAYLVSKGLLCLVVITGLEFFLYIKLLILSFECFILSYQFLIFDKIEFVIAID